jgi:hypothetical protein
MNFERLIVRRVLAEEEATTFAEFGLVFILVAAIVLSLAVALGGGSLEFFQQAGTVG